MVSPLTLATELVCTLRQSEVRGGGVVAVLIVVLRLAGAKLACREWYGG